MWLDVVFWDNGERRCVGKGRRVGSQGKVSSVVLSIGLDWRTGALAAPAERTWEKERGTQTCGMDGHTVVKKDLNLTLDRRPRPRPFPVRLQRAGVSVTPRGGETSLCPGNI